MPRTRPLMLAALLLAGACGSKDETRTLALADLDPDPFAGLDSVELVIGTATGEVRQTYAVSGSRPEMQVTFESSDVRSVTLLGYEGTCLRAKGQTTVIRGSGDTPLVFARLGRFQTFVSGGMGARLGHTATRLADGRVLVVTDQMGEVFDPTTGELTNVGQTAMNRSGHSALRLSDGRVLLVGGASGGQVNVEWFDPASMSFVDPGITLTVGRGEPSALLEVAPGQVVVAGGDIAASAERIDLSAGTSTPLDGFAGRRAHAIVNTAGGEALIVGGDATGVTALVERTRDGTQLAADPLAVAREDATALEMPDRGAVVVLGGHDGSQVPLLAMEAIRGGSVVGLGDLDAALAVNQGAATALGWDGSWGLVAGGSAAAGVSDAVTLLHWPQDDPATLVVQSVHPDDPDQTPIALRSARRGAAALPLPDGSILIAGGIASGGAQVENYELYRPPVPCP